MNAEERRRNKGWGGAQFRIIEHSSRNARSVAWGGGVVRAHNNFDLGENVGGSSRIGDDKMNGADTLAVPGKNAMLVNMKTMPWLGSVHAHVLRKALSDDHFKTLQCNINIWLL
jgi:hypothetical protein